MRLATYCLDVVGVFINVIENARVTMSILIMAVGLRVVWLIPSGQDLYKHTLHFQALQVSTAI